MRRRADGGGGSIDDYQMSVSHAFVNVAYWCSTGDISSGRMCLWWSDHKLQAKRRDAGETVVIDGL